jgi:MFS family permease
VRSLTGSALAATAGLVLADSSVVVLALPDIYRELDVSVTTVTWVLIGFNVVLAAAAVPAALAARSLGPARVTVAGLVVFAAASLICGLAPSIAVLLAGRCAQALGGAAAVCASLELLPAAVGSERRAATTWAAAGAAGAALGPGIGGLLTELVSWQSIFLVQVPVAVVLSLPLVGLAVGERGPEQIGAEVRRAGRPHLAPNLALALISASLAAALFLLVLLLIEGWRLTPIAAAAAVTVTPIAALIATPLVRRLLGATSDGEERLGPGPRAMAGIVLIAGGLAGLALLPSASVFLTIPPQILVGAGLSLTLAALTESALEGRAPQAIHGGWTIAARHAGVVAGLLVLTPVFTADLISERKDAEQAGTAALLDSRISPELKIDLAQRIDDRLAEEGDKVPVIGPAFDPLPDDPAERAGTIALRDQIEGEIDRAATHAFSTSFWIGVGFALAALATLAVAGRRVEL